MKYKELRDALAAGPTHGPWEVIGESGALWAKNGCIANVTQWVNSREEAEANTSYLATVDPDTLRSLLAERDALHSALQWIVQRAEEGGYPDGRCLQEARAALSAGD